MTFAVVSVIHANSIGGSCRDGHASSSVMAGAGVGGGVSLPLQNVNYVKSADALRHWDKPVVTVFVNATGDPDRAPQQISDSVAKGLALWNAKLTGTVQLEATNDEDSADIVIAFVPKHSLPGGAIGRTDVSYHVDDQILTHADVNIDRGLGTEQLVQVSAHELGHALGIQGHSPDKRDLMYTYAHIPAEITDRDLNTMRVSYPTPIPTPNSGAESNDRTFHRITGIATEFDSAAEFTATAGR